MHKLVLATALLAVSFIFLVLPSGQYHASQSDTVHPDIQMAASPHVTIYSTLPNSPYALLVPLNSSGAAVYPVWHIQLYGKGSFSLSVNGTVVDSGFSTGSFNLTYTFVGTRAKAVFDFNVQYTFNDQIVPELSDHSIQSVYVYSCYPGQSQFLTVQNGVSGALMYTRWTAILQSTQNVSFSVYVGNQNLLTGYFTGSKDITFNVTGSTASVIIGVGKTVYKYPSELISTVPVSKYYGPKPPLDTATFLDEVFAAVKGVFGIFPALLLSYIGVKPLVIARKERTPVVW